MPGISLCPGYHQVDAFGSNEEYESEEEITYVTLDLGAVEPTLVPSSSSYRLIVSAHTSCDRDVADMHRAVRNRDSTLQHPICNCQALYSRASTSLF